MNCLDCRDSFSAASEHLLAPATALEFQRHLTICAECREQAALTRAVQQRLRARGETAVSVSLTMPVMRRIRAASQDRVAPPIPQFRRGWLAAIAGAAAISALLLVALLLAPHDTRAQAVATMTRGINVTPRLTTIHLQGRMRTLPADNFSFIDGTHDFVPIELWKELDGQKRWRIQKPDRIAVMDGTTTQLYLPSSRTLRKAAVAAAAAFDTGWLHSVADIETTLTNGLAMAQARGWKMELTQSTDSAGVVHQVVTIDVPAPVASGDYLYNKFLGTAETRRLYRFSDQSGQLEALQIYLRAGTDYVLVFEATAIEYNQAFDPGVFTLELPEDVTMAELGVGNTVASSAVVDPKYTSLTAEQSARAVLEAFARQDWQELQVFWPMPINERVKTALGGIAVVRIGEAFSSAGSSAQFVPYEIRLSDGTTATHTLVLKKDSVTGVWQVDGGL